MFIGMCRTTLIWQTNAFCQWHSCTYESPAPIIQLGNAATDECETYLSLLLLAVQLTVLDLQPGLGHALRPQLATLAQTHSAADERQLSQYGKQHG